MKVGDLVKAVPPFVLCSGSGTYDKVVVVNCSPLMLISQYGDMCWNSGRACDAALVNVVTRLGRDINR